MRDGWETQLVLASLALVALIAVAGCVGSDREPASEQTAGVEQVPAEPADPVTVVTDPEGDATQKNSDWAQNAAPCLETEEGPGASTPCQAPGTPADSSEPAGGVPASPARDILEVRFQETPTTLEVFLDVAELHEGFEGAVDGGNGTEFAVLWGDPESGCLNIPDLWVVPGRDNVQVLSFLFVGCAGPFEDGEDPPPPCQSAFCLWDVPFEVEFGAPATLHWSIPREGLAGDGAGQTIQEPVAVTNHEAADERHLRLDGRVSTGGSWDLSGEDYDYDRSQPGEGFTFEFNHTGAPLETGPLEIADEGDVAQTDPPDRPDLSIGNLTFVPGPQVFRFTVELAEVAETPENHTVAVLFGVPGGHVVAGYEAQGGERSPFANLISPTGEAASIPAEVRVEPGTPGQASIEVAREDLPSSPPGAAVQTLYAITNADEDRTRPAGGLGTVQTTDLQAGDLSGLGPLHGLNPGAQTQEEPTVRISDAPGDVDPPPDLTESRERYDLLGVEVVSPAPDEMRFSLGVADLSNLDPPANYDAVFYAVGVEHPGGETMLGHYRSRDRPGGEFLCAPDTTVLTDQPTDPTQSAWTTVEGTIQTASSGGGGPQDAGTGAGSAALMVTAPPACFGLDEGTEELNVTALEAGSYLIRRSQLGDPSETRGTRVEELDALAAEEEFHAAFEEPVVEQPSFWAQPFGVANFWDIFGGIIAVLTVAATFGIWLRRRWTFKRYLDEVRRVQQTYRGSAQARARELVDLRRDLYEDLEANRISDSHYPIVLDRLRARLTSARLASIGQAFYHLPPHLALRIEAMLDDGQLAEEEAEVLEPIIEDSGMDAQSREVLRERLRQWVAEDREHLDADVASSA